jgi:hypothetical protein
MGRVGGPGGAIGDTLTADLAVLDGVRARFERQGTVFTQDVVPLGHGYDHAVTGSGQFVGDLRAGAVAFLLSWRAVFDVAGTDCRLIAGNVGGQAVDLQAVDTHLAARVRL